MITWYIPFKEKTQRVDPVIIGKRAIFREHHMDQRIQCCVCHHEADSASYYQHIPDCSFSEIYLLLEVLGQLIFFVFFVVGEVSVAQDLFLVLVD